MKNRKVPCPCFSPKYQSRMSTYGCAKAFNVKIFYRYVCLVFQLSFLCVCVAVIHKEVCVGMVDHNNKKLSPHRMFGISFPFDHEGVDYNGIHKKHSEINGLRAKVFLFYVLGFCMGFIAVHRLLRVYYRRIFVLFALPFVRGVFS